MFPQTLKAMGSIGPWAREGGAEASGDSVPESSGARISPGQSSGVGSKEQQRKAHLLMGPPNF